jgi:Flp pilus assembly protein TadG
MARRRTADRGAAAVEMALVLPLLLLLVFGIIDFGRMLNAQIALTEAAREAARAHVLGADPAPRFNAAANGLTGSTYNVDENCAGATAADDAVVTTSYQFSFITPVGILAGLLPGGSVNGTVRMQGKGVMPCRA